MGSRSREGSPEIAVWLGFERRWRDDLADAALPGRAVDPAAWDRFDAVAPPLLRWGFRAAVWALTWGPVLRARAPLGRLPADERDRWLAEVAASRWFLVRQIAVAAKLALGLVAARPRPP